MSAAAGAGGLAQVGAAASEGGDELQSIYDEMAAEALREQAEAEAEEERLGNYNLSDDSDIGDEDLMGYAARRPLITSPIINAPL